VLNTTGIVLDLVNACASGRLRVSDCGPVWQLVVIAVLLVVMVATLLVLRLRSRLLAGKA
jgi:hypothetical protein